MSEHCRPKGRDRNTGSACQRRQGTPLIPLHSPPWSLAIYAPVRFWGFRSILCTMPASRTVRRSASERACLECQKRKTKCVAAPEGDICAYCLKAGKTCVFEGPHERTSLTRRNLDAAEARCRELEKLLQEVQSEIRIDTEKEGATQESASRPVPHRPQSTEDPPAGPYEWNEGLDASVNDPSPDGEYTRDGMASLTRQGNGSGYLGEHSCS
jgi:transcriptional regulatory protein GAL4